MYTCLAISVFLLLVMPWLLMGQDAKAIRNNPILGCFAVVWFVSMIGFLFSGVFVIVRLLN